MRYIMGRTINSPVITNDQGFTRLLAAPIPVLFLLWNGQGVPDKVNQALLDLASQEAGQLLVAKINARENPEAARHFNVRQTPVLIGVVESDEVTRVAQPQPGDIRRHAEFMLGRAPKPEPTPRQQPPAGEGQVARPLHITDAAFEREVLHSETPVLVDFWAPWCGPCHMIAPTLDKLAREYAGRLKVVKVNVDENSHYAGLFGVQGIPTLLLVRNGRVANRLVGAQPEPILRAQVEILLKD
jgi:thioredoxin 1